MFYLKASFCFVWNGTQFNLICPSHLKELLSHKRLFSHFVETVAVGTRKQKSFQKRTSYEFSTLDVAVLVYAMPLYLQQKHNSLKLKTWVKQLLFSLPLSFALHGIFSTFSRLLQSISETFFFVTNCYFQCQDFSLLFSHLRVISAFFFALKWAE